MPNWVMTKVTVYGNDSENVVKEIFTPSFSFNKFIPEPETPNDCDEKYILKSKEDAEKHFLGWNDKDERKWFNWYDWHCDFWGTKWEPDELDYNENTFWFETAWACPIPILKQISKQYPKYNFQVEVENECCSDVQEFCIQDGQLLFSQQ